jgi:hypothetical protein
MAVTLGSEEEEHRATSIAEARLRQALTQLRLDRFDEIIISTLPPGVSRWLGMDLPSRAERKFKLPVTTVTAHI